MKQRDAEHYRKMMRNKRSARVPFTLAARAIFAARPHMQSGSYARWLKNHYGESLSSAQVLKLMDGE